MKIFFTLLLFCSFSSLFSQVYTSSCVATPQMENLYRYDIAKTAVFRILQTNSTYKDSIVIPALVKDSVAKVFYAIQNMPANSVKDTILHLFGYQNFASYSYGLDSLHFGSNFPFSYYNITNLSVKGVQAYDFGGSIPWTSEWASGNYNNTSNPQVNQLVNTYQLSITSSFTIGIYYFNVKSSSAINSTALANRFNALASSPTAFTPLTYFGDGNAVELFYESDGIKITYSNRCGDCPAGCTYGRSWTFKVYHANCNVQYLGAANFGAPNPPNYNVYTCTGVILPVTFGSITGYLQSGKAALNWKVLTQQNVKEYIIERLDNGQQFYTAGIVAAANALTAVYNWKDVSLLTGTAWYRIKTVDLDGKFKYSSIVKLSGATKGNSFTIYPNPMVSRTFTIQFGTPASGPMNVDLYSIDGKKVWASTLSPAPQTVSRTLTLPVAIAPGLYALVVENNNGSYRQTLLISE